MPSIDPSDLVNKTKRRLDEIRGDTLEEALELKKRARTFKKYKEAVVMEAKGRREKHARKPVYYKGDGFDADSGSQQKIQGAIQLARQYNYKNEDSWETKWKLYDNTFTLVDQEKLEVVFSLMGEQVQKAYSRESEILQKIETAETVEDLRNIEITSGWP